MSTVQRNKNINEKCEKKQKEKTIIVKFVVKSSYCCFFIFHKVSYLRKNEGGKKSAKDKQK